MEIREMILRKLSTLNIEYGMNHTPPKLALLADDWARELADENPASVAAALDTHRRECSRFPTLAHVLALLPRCRVHAYRAALPETPPMEENVWRQRAQDIRDALRGDTAARARLNALTDSTDSVVRQCNARSLA